jgi:hypothetical protein
MGALGTVRLAVAFHVAWLGLESIAALFPDRDR